MGATHRVGCGLSYSFLDRWLPIHHHLLRCRQEEERRWSGGGEDPRGQLRIEPNPFLAPSQLTPPRTGQVSSGLPLPLHFPRPLDSHPPTTTGTLTHPFQPPSPPRRTSLSGTSAIGQSHHPPLSLHCPPSGSSHSAGRSYAYHLASLVKTEARSFPDLVQSTSQAAGKGDGEAQPAAKQYHRQKLKRNYEYAQH